MIDDFTVDTTEFMGVLDTQLVLHYLPIFNEK
jgi:hypothetical protein